MPSHCENLAAALRDPSSPFGAAVQSMRDKGMPLKVAVHDQTTGQVYVADDNGGLEIAHGAIRAMVTGGPWRDPGSLNPVPSVAVRRSPKLLAEHNAEVASMLLYILKFYRPDIAGRYRIEGFITRMVSYMNEPRERRALSALASNHDRWDAITTHFVKLMDAVAEMNNSPHQ